MAEKEPADGSVTLESFPGIGLIRVVSRTRLFALAESLGGVESLIGHPATMSHVAMTPEERAARGISDGLIRLSAGIEDVDDLLEDLSRALAR